MKPNPKNFDMAGPYLEILTALNRAGVEYIVAGGVACILQGVERITMDVDIALHMQPENLKRFLRVMNELGLRPRVPIAAADLVNPEAFRQMVTDKHAIVFSFLDPDRAVRHVDIFLTDDLGYHSLLPDSETVEIDGFPLRLVNKRRLLAIKLAINPPRQKDVLDIEFLRQHDS